MPARSNAPLNKVVAWQCAARLRAWLMPTKSQSSHPKEIRERLAVVVSSMDVELTSAMDALAAWWTNEKKAIQRAEASKPVVKSQPKRGGKTHQRN